MQVWLLQILFSLSFSVSLAEMEETLFRTHQERPGKSLSVYMCSVLIHCTQYIPLQFDQSSIELAYYNDKSAKVKRGTINLSKFVGIRPNAKIGNKDNIFAIETEERKYILRAPDAVTKNIWLAKLCELCGQGKKKKLNCYK